MQIHVSFLTFAVILAVSVESRPSWPGTYLSSYYPAETIDTNSQLLQYQTSPYYFYNLQTNLNAATILAEEKPLIQQLPPYSFYHGSPFYTVGWPLHPVNPILKTDGSKETPKMAPPSTTTEKPDVESGETIENLDEKLKPEKTKKTNGKSTEKDNGESDNIDSVNDTENDSTTK